MLSMTYSCVTIMCLTCLLLLRIISDDTFMRNVLIWTQSYSEEDIAMETAVCDHLNSNKDIFWVRHSHKKTWVRPETLDWASVSHWLTLQMSWSLEKYHRWQRFSSCVRHHNLLWKHLGTLIWSSSRTRFSWLGSPLVPACCYVSHHEPAKREIWVWVFGSNATGTHSRRLWTGLKLDPHQSFGFK